MESTPEAATYPLTCFHWSRVKLGYAVTNTSNEIGRAPLLRFEEIHSTSKSLSAWRKGGNVFRSKEGGVCWLSSDERARGSPWTDLMRADSEFSTQGVW